MFKFNFKSTLVLAAFLPTAVRQVSSAPMGPKVMMGFDGTTEVMDEDGKVIFPETTDTRRRLFEPTNINRQIPNGGTVVGTVTFPDLLKNECTILDVNVILHIAHAAGETLEMTLTSGTAPSMLVTLTPATATAVTLVSDTPITFDDFFAAHTFPTGYPLSSTSFKSNSLGLTTLNTKIAPVGGLWKLTIKDTNGSDGVAGTFVTGQIEITCAPGPSNTGIFVRGDPHFSTWSDEHFDFQGECDLVLVDNPDFKDGLGMSVHARTKLHGTWSAVSGAAIKIGDDVLEVHGEDLPLINGVEFPLDVKDGTEYAFPFSLGGYSLTVQQRGPHSRRFIVHLGDGERIFINTFKEFVDFMVEDPHSTEFAGTVGLLGSYSLGTKLSRDGKTIIEDPDAFGQEWQVRDTDIQLFTVKDGPQYPTKCNMPEELTAEQRRLRNLTRKVSPEEAEKACAKSGSKFNCVADVLSSDDLDMAELYANL